MKTDIRNWDRCSLPFGKGGVWSLSIAFLSILFVAPALAASLTEQLAVERTRPMAPTLPRESFSVQPGVESATISPDGQQVAWIRIVGEQRSLWVQSTAPGAAPRAMLRRIDRGQAIWSGDSRWLYLVSDGAARRLAMAGQPGSGLVATLGGAEKVRFAGLDPWHAAALVTDEISTVTGTRYRLWRIGDGGRRTLLAHGGRPIVDAAIDRAGRAAFVKLADADHHLILSRRVDGGFGVLMRCVRMERCGLLGVTPDQRGLFMASDIGGRRAVLRIEPDGRRTILHADPAAEVDLDAVALDRLTGMPAIAGYRGSAPAAYGLTPVTVRGVARLKHALGSGDAGIETSAGPWLVRERDGRLQGDRWQLFDPESGRLRILIDDPQRRLSPTVLARTLPVDWRASDGMRIHGLLTVPPGRDLARAPLVVIVHGGPWSRDFADYSALTQLLANRGFAVFRPQFRGSTGYGRAYTFAAASDFGDGRVQRDIEDGTRHLLAMGVGDRRRVAIMGASFGGYSTLQALSNGSGLYRTGIALVPPADFGWTTRWAALSGALPEAEGIPFAASLAMLGLDAGNPEIARRLSIQSPRARVAAMRTPLLILAAGRDERVPIRSVIDYAAHLRVMGRPARIVVARGQPHATDDPMARAASLYMVEATLRRHLTGTAAPRPDARLRDWMAANMDVL